MRRYDDEVAVRTTGAGAPDQFVWRTGLWQVQRVQAHWVQTGAWWLRRPEAAAALAGAGGAASAPEVRTGGGPELAEQRCWRVEARRPGATGVFELVLEVAEGCWRLTGCAD
ncbi:DUF6504 family protein [Nocardioides nanhaiensis]|uniref:DUF6504 domain-containing protein n=1 Tax=Nocardioides nanhaiensis TaxID=1476871 RepID=A0ABP8WUA6_9ACTN